MLPPKTTIALLACALLSVAAVAPSASAGSTGSGCESIAPADGWTCTFADEFDGSALDRDKWSVMTTAASGFSHAWECYVDEPANVSVESGALHLTSTKSSAPEGCGSLFQSPYRSGMVFSKDKFSQAYGRFEARIRFPRGTGFTSSWWLWPEDMAYGQQSGEIDIAEHFGSHPQIVSPYVHIIGSGGEERGRGEYCTVADPSDGFHTYALEWQPSGSLVFLYDGVKCMTFDGWDPGAPLNYPQPFDKEFFLNLTLAHGWFPNAVTADTPFPATMAVDYVRVWSQDPDDQAPPVTTPPATEPPATEPPATEPPATEPPARRPNVKKLKVAETSLSRLLRSGTLAVKVGVDAPATVSLTGKVTGKGEMPRSPFKTAKLRFSQPGTRAGKLTLTEAGRTALKRRSTATVKVTAECADHAGHKASEQKRLRLAS